MLEQRAREFVAEARRLVADRPRLQALAARIDIAGRRIDEPMRVAIVGQIKKGKSTLVNALLGERLVATGVLELTFNVNELGYADSRSLTVVFKDGRPPEPRRLDELEDLTRRSDERIEYLKAIRKIEVGYPNPFLRKFRLIDTPGLNSVYGADSANTLAVIGRSPADVEAESAAQLGEADAVVFAFSRAVSEFDASLAEEVRGPIAETASPLKAIGVLTRCEGYWPPGPESGDGADPLHFDPMSVGDRLAEECLGRREIAALFYTVVPVCNLLGFGAGTLSAEELEDLTLLSKVEPLALYRRLRDTQRFATRDFDDIPLDPGRRRRLVEHLSSYGVHLACRLLRDDSVGEEELRKVLLDMSGVAALRRLLLAHFGNRALLIKLDAALRDIGDAVATLRRAGAGPDTAAVDAVADLAQRFRSAERGFAELDILGSHYRGQLSLSLPEVRELLEVTGEFGTGAAARLGLPDAAPVGELAERARGRVNAWSLRLMDPLLDRHTRGAVRVVQRSYERIAYHVDEARRHLDLND